VTDFGNPRAIAALITDVAFGATISLIDSTTGQTMATTVTSAGGSFQLTFSNGFRPLANRTYYLEAVKRLPVGGTANRAGAGLARVRTLVFWNGGQWNTLTGLGVSLGQTTTTVAAIASLRGFSIADQQALLGTLNAFSFSPTASLSLGEFNTVSTMVGSTLGADQDPMESISFDATLMAGNPGNPALWYGSKARDLILFDTYSVNGVNQATASLVPPYNVITFNGQNFPSAATISLGPVPVSTWSVNATRTQLTVTLAGNNYCGGLVINQGTGTWYGPFVPVSGTVGTLAGNGLYRYADARGTFASFNSWLNGMVIDGQGNLYLADPSNCVVRRISPTGTVTTYAGSGSWGGTDAPSGPATSAQFGSPNGLGFDNVGNLYVADYTGNVRKVTPSGAVTTLAGAFNVSGEVDGTGTAARFNAPYACTTDATGNVYVADFNGQTIRQVTPGGTVTTIAGSPSISGFANGTGSGAMFNQPTSICPDGSGNFLVADAGNNRVRLVTPTGTVTTYAGTGTWGAANGTVASASFAYPSAVYRDGSGNVYVSETGSGSRIRKITGGVVTTLVGGSSVGYVDGPISAALVNSPYGIAVGPNGVLYFADRGNVRIRAICP
jgi:hypothetical protein